MDRGKPKYLAKPCLSATLSTTNPTWTDMGSNPGLHGGRLVANHLSHSISFSIIRFSFMKIYCCMFMIVCAVLTILHFVVHTQIVKVHHIILNHYIISYIVPTVLY
jgi:hypothetical protein